MASLANLVIQITADVQKAIDGMKNVANQMNKLGGSAKKTQGHFKGWASVVDGFKYSMVYSGFAMIRDGVSNMAHSIVDAQVEYERMKFQMQSVVSMQMRQADSTLSVADAWDVAGGEAEKLIHWIDQLNISSPYAELSIVSLFNTLTALEVPIEHAKELTAAIVNWGTATARSDEALTNVGKRLGVVATRGRMLAEDVNSLIDNGIPALSILSEHFGITVAEVQENMRKGLVDGQEALDAIENWMTTSFPDTVEQVSGSLWGLMGSFSDIWAINLRTFMMGFWDAAKPVLLRISTFLQSDMFSGMVESWGDTFGELSATVGDFVMDVLDQFSGMSGNVDVDVDMDLDGGSGMAKVFSELMKLAGNVKDSVVNAFISMGNAWLGFSSLLSESTPAISILASAIEGINAHWDIFGGVLERVIQLFVGKAIIGLFIKLGTAIMGLYNPIGLIIVGVGALWYAFDQDWLGIRTNLLGVFEAITEGSEATSQAAKNFNEFGQMMGLIGEDANWLSTEVQILGMELDFSDLGPTWKSIGDWWQELYEKMNFRQMGEEAQGYRWDLGEVTDALGFFLEGTKNVLFTTEELNTMMSAMDGFRSFGDTIRAENETLFAFIDVIVWLVKELIEAGIAFAKFVGENILGPWVSEQLSAIESFLTAISEFRAELAETGSFWTSLWSTMTSHHERETKRNEERTRGLWDYIVGTTRTKGNETEQASTQAFTTMTNNATNLFEQLRGNVTSNSTTMSTNVRGSFQEMSRQVMGDGETMSTSVTQSFTRMNSDAQTNLTSINSLTTSNFSSMLSTVQTGGSSMVTSFRQSGSLMESGWATEIAPIPTKTMNTINGAIQNVNGLSGSASSAGSSVGSSLAGGIASGIASRISEIAGAARRVVSRAIEAARRAGESRSPSRKMIARAGTPLALGLLKPMEDAEKQMEKTTAKVIRAALNVTIPEQSKLIEQMKKIALPVEYHVQPEVLLNERKDSFNDRESMSDRDRRESMNDRDRDERQRPVEIVNHFNIQSQDPQRVAREVVKIINRQLS